jgi:hypothetical protein
VRLSRVTFAIRLKFASSASSKSFWASMLSQNWNAVDRVNAKLLDRVARL